MSVASLVITVKTLKQHPCPTAAGWLSKFWHNEDIKLPNNDVFNEIFKENTFAVCKKKYFKKQCAKLCSVTSAMSTSLGREDYAEMLTVDISGLHYMIFISSSKAAASQGAATSHVAVQI